MLTGFFIGSSSRKPERPTSDEPLASLRRVTRSDTRNAKRALRSGTWRAEHQVAYLTPADERALPSPAAVTTACAELATKGFRQVVTGALHPLEQVPFLEAGFEVREELLLLVHDLRDVPAPPPAPIGRVWSGSDRRGVLAVDHAAFQTFWRLDRSGLADTLSATPSRRFRVTRGGWRAGRRVTGYAITGRAGTRGFLQRLAVDPRRQGGGLGRALAIDGLDWLRHRGAIDAVVNTQVGNQRALSLYQGLGFSLAHERLAVLTLALSPSRPTA